VTAIFLNQKEYKMLKIKYIILIPFFLIISINTSYSEEIIYIISQHEADELSKIYNSAGGEYWTNDYGWSSTVSTTLTQTSTPYNMSLYGVYFERGEIISSDEDATVYSATATEIVLAESNLRGTIPDLDLPNITYLNFSKNALTGEIPNFNMPKLEDLIISENQLTGKIPDFNMPKLEVLWLRKNKLSEEIPDFDLPELERLWLDENQLSGFVPNLDLPSLKELFISRNNLSGEIPDFNLPEVDLLVLEFNQLSGEIPDFNLPKVESMNLSYNELSGSVPNFNIPKLESINLRVNKLDGAIPDFNNMPNLKGISLDSNKFTFKALETNLGKYDYYQYKDQDTTLPIEQIGNKLKVTVDGSSNTYTWFLEEQEVSSGISKTYRPSETGTYHCEVTNSLLPDLTLSSGTINVLTVGIAVEDEDRYLYYLYNFPPYPQPASNEVKIPIYWRLGNPVSSDNIKIYNNMGVEIKQENKIKIEESTSINGEVIWDASGVDSGIYFLEIRHGTSTKYVKILLE
jgi:Secretion system C-terminal sorting domain/Leucine Rich Repeat